jgi:hypothetical protein
VYLNLFYQGQWVDPADSRVKSVRWVTDSLSSRLPLTCASAPASYQMKASPDTDRSTFSVYVAPTSPTATGACLVAAYVVAGEQSGNASITFTTITGGVITTDHLLWGPPRSSWPTILTSVR